MKTTPQMDEHVIFSVATDCSDYWEVGDQDVTAIFQHPPQGEGDRWYYDVVFKDESVERLFNVVDVCFAKPKEPANGTQTDV